MYLVRFHPFWPLPGGHMTMEDYSVLHATAVVWQGAWFGICAWLGLAEVVAVWSFIHDRRLPWNR